MTLPEQSALPSLRTVLFNPTNMDELLYTIRQQSPSGGLFRLIASSNAALDTMVVPAFLAWLDSQVGGEPYDSSPLSEVTIRLEGGLAVLAQPSKVFVTL